MNMEDAFSYARKHLCGVTCRALTAKIAVTASVISDIHGIPCLFDGVTSVSVEKSMRIRPDVWELAKHDKWEVCGGR